ncbi:MAG TPA: carboxypeptidase-like regulatory domain-containing protein, partial [Ferruginibacter sp.]|nr:carboxypeptidase-like regulatory domain-containing protein [Ferruginibacter sp.]
MNKILLIITLLFYNTSNAQVTGIPVTGTVISGSNNAPVPGITIQLRKAKTIVVSNRRGDFTILLSYDTDTLDIFNAGYSYVSLPVSINMSLPVTIRLVVSVKTLETVTVNTGYQ